MAITDIIAIGLGLFVGLSLGALGGGGSTLAVPILVFVAHLEPSAATSASLIVVGVAAAVGAVGHWRHGHVRVGPGLAFGAAGVVGSYLGTRLNSALPDNVLLLAFSALIIFVAVRMYRKASVSQIPVGTDDLIAPVATTADADAPEPATLDRPGPADAGPADTDQLAAPGTAGGTAAAVLAVDIDDRPHTALAGGDYVRLAVAATLVGVLTGLFGVGGGFAVVPALVIFMKFNTKDAIGTSLLVIAINTAIALFMRRNSLDTFDWGIVAPFVITTTIGVIVGLRVAKNIDADRLTKWFAVMLFVVALYTAGSVIVAEMA